MKAETFIAKRVGNVIVTAPLFSTVYGHKVWAAILFDAGYKSKLVGRIFLKGADGGMYNIAEMRAGDWVEFAADIPCLKPSGYESKQRRRWVGKVLKMTDDEVVFEKYVGVLSERYEELFKEG